MTPPTPRRSRLALLRPLLLCGLAVPALAATGGGDVGMQVNLATTAVMAAPPPIVMVLAGAALIGGALVRRSARLTAAARTPASSRAS